MRMVKSSQLLRADEGPRRPHHQRRRPCSIVTPDAAPPRITVRPRRRRGCHRDEAPSTPSPLERKHGVGFDKLLQPDRPRRHVDEDRRLLASPPASSRLDKPHQRPTTASELEDDRRSIADVSCPTSSSKLIDPDRQITAAQLKPKAASIDPDGDHRRSGLQAGDRSRRPSSPLPSNSELSRRSSSKVRRSVRAGHRRRSSQRHGSSPGRVRPRTPCRVTSQAPPSTHSASSSTSTSDEITALQILLQRSPTPGGLTYADIRGTGQRHRQAAHPGAGPPTCSGQAYESLDASEGPRLWPSPCNTDLVSHLCATPSATTDELERLPRPRQRALRRLAPPTGQHAGRTFTDDQTRLACA